MQGVSALSLPLKPDSNMQSWRFLIRAFSSTGNVQTRRMFLFDACGRKNAKVHICMRKHQYHISCGINFLWDMLTTHSTLTPLIALCGLLESDKGQMDSSIFAKLPLTFIYMRDNLAVCYNQVLCRILSGTPSWYWKWWIWIGDYFFFVKSFVMLLVYALCAFFPPPPLWG